MKRDEQRVNRALDRVIRKRSRFAWWNKEILKKQRRLRRAMNDKEWTAFLQLEDLVHERNSEIVDLAIRLALQYALFR